MTENLNNIWKNMDYIPQKSTKKNFFKKRIKMIKHVEKEINKENFDENDLNMKNSKNVHFLNKKRGRKLKHLTGINNKEKAHDRNSDDNLKRKVKTHFHNYIIEFLNSKMKEQIGKKNLKFVKIKSSITQNITVEFNQKLFNKKIKDILRDVSKKYQNKNINSECINYIMENKQLNSSLVDLLNITYKDMYLNYYLKSTKSDFDSEPNESYEFHKEKLRNKFGEEYLKKYIKNAENLISFYNNCKIRKKKKNNENLLKVPLIKELDETKINKKNNDNVSYYLYEQNINNKINYDEVEFLGDNKISRFTQTEIKKIDEESETE